MLDQLEFQDEYFSPLTLTCWWELLGLSGKPLIEIVRLQLMFKNGKLYVHSGWRGVLDLKEKVKKCMLAVFILRGAHLAK